MQKTNDIPEIGDLVVVTVTKVEKFGAEVKLDEYKGLNGFIHIAEVANGWVRYIRDHLREGQKTVCKVLQIDSRRKSVDLSLKRVNEHQKREKISEWKNDQKAEKLMELISVSLKKSPEECMIEFGNELVEKYGSLYSAFEEAATEEDDFYSGVRAKWRNAFLKTAMQNVQSPFVKIGGTKFFRDLTSRGIEKIKNCLDIGDVADVTIRYAGAPRYLLKVKEKEYKSAEDKLKNVIQTITDNCKKNGVSFEFIRDSKEK
ncbi:MAG: translation initiation factor IF-2 subunit alpha [Candidatus Thermoplasmatota archaeon]|nr:translation initiation factor IF-2 subunit alpha [Candidatus Thermoplasmatota archaeon]